MPQGRKSYQARRPCLVRIWWYQNVSTQIADIWHMSMAAVHCATGLFVLCKCVGRSQQRGPFFSRPEDASQMPAHLLEYVGHNILGSVACALVYICAQADRHTQILYFPGLLWPSVFCLPQCNHSLSCIQIVYLTHATLPGVGGACF